MSGAPLSMAAHHHALRDVDTMPGGAVPRTRHAADVPARGLTSLTVDGAQAGSQPLFRRVTACIT